MALIALVIEGLRWHRIVDILLWEQNAFALRSTTNLSIGDAKCYIVDLLSHRRESSYRAIEKYFRILTLILEWEILSHFPCFFL